jgi:hypothetical protein
MKNTIIPFQLENLKITLDHQSGFSDSDQSFKLTIHGSGLVLFETSLFRAFHGNSKCLTIKPEEVLKIYCIAHKEGFFEMRRSYDFEIEFSIQDGAVYPSCISTTDLPSAEITISNGKKIKKVYNYQGAPTGFAILERYIMKICKVEKLRKHNQNDSFF